MDDMTERRRPSPGRGPRSPRSAAQGDEPNPYRDSGDAPAAVKAAAKPVKATKTVAKTAAKAATKTAPKTATKTATKTAAAKTAKVAKTVAAPVAAAAPAPKPRARKAASEPVETPAVRAPAPPVVAAPASPPAPRAESAPERSAAPYAGERAPGGQDRGAERVAERPSQERPPYADRQSGDRQNGDRPAGERQGGDRPEKRGRFQRRRGRGRNRFREAGPEGAEGGAPQGQPRHERGPRPDQPRNDRHQRNEPRHERGPRPERPERQDRPDAPGTSTVVAEANITGWYDPARGDGGFIRRSAASYLPQPGDPFIPGWMARQFQLRRADLLQASWGHDHRRRPTVVEIQTINEAAPDPNERRKDFKSLTASYPNKRLTLETGRPAKFGPRSHVVRSTSSHRSATGSAH